MKLIFLIFLILNLNFQMELDVAFMDGFKISKEEAKAIEEKLKENPDDLVLRVKIIGYYSILRFKDEKAKEEYQKNVLWIIKNKPDLEAKNISIFKLDPLIDKDAYNEGKNLWLENLEKFKDNINVLANAADYFLIYEKELSEKFYKRLQELEPKNPQWYEKLGFLYKLDLRKLKDNEKKKELAKRSLEEFEKAYKLETEAEKSYTLIDLAEVAFEAGEFGEAKEFAKELLEKSKKNEKKWYYGNSIHYGNIVLGKIALAENKIKDAKKYLLEAGKTPGSPQLNSFGPDFSLAEELLKKGEKKAVLEYLKLCEKFWKSGQEKLKDWQVLIKGGRMPDFRKKY